MKVMSYVLVGVLASSAAPALADDAAPSSEPLMPGIASPQPVKAALPRRENRAVGVASVELFGGSNFGFTAAFETRVWESFGSGLGIRLADRGGLFWRFDVGGVSFNHWGVLGYADYVFGHDLWLTGAVIIPLRGDNYLRATLSQTIWTNTMNSTTATTFGVGVERDLW
ncbi:MAG: hypothetical protein E6J90_28800 [Deltaproteobacteria bacterium]|nr:MAG: hypothetical protein E6J91_39005 [Deltaproteobacteria bacterium]TMQ13361.1 MAG: hypothetical protein E6J90_28800 [Deltaproteobacteria bacterium]